MSNKELEVTNPMKELAGFLHADPEVLKSVLKKTVFKNCLADEEFMSAVMTANAYKLNPILKQIYAFATKGGGIIPVVSVDGWVQIVNSQANYDGMEQNENRDEKGNVISITTKMYHKDKKYPTSVTEYMSECKDEAKDPWKRWPIRMLNHKSYIQCARKAFGISGIYDEDEAARIAESIPVGKEEVEQPLEKKTVEKAKEVKKEKTTEVAAEVIETTAVEENKKTNKISMQALKKAANNTVGDIQAFVKDIKCFVTKSAKEYTVINAIDSYQGPIHEEIKIKIWGKHILNKGSEYLFGNVKVTEYVSKTDGTNKRDYIAESFIEE